MGIDIVEMTNQKIINFSGLKIIKDILDGTNLKKRIDKLINHGLSVKKIDVIYNAIFLLTLGKTNFDDISEFVNNEAYKILGDGNVIPESTFRQNLDKIAIEEKLKKIIIAENMEMIKKNNEKLCTCYKDFVPLDLDVTPMDNSNSKKEGVSWTYKNFMGYAPIMAYIGQEGYLINTELRNGSQHCQQGTKEFLEETIKLSQELTEEKILLRMDSGNDAGENLAICIALEKPIYYIIKRNLRRESKEKWLKTALELNTEKKITAKKTEYFGIKNITRILEINGEKKECELKIAFHVKKIKEEHGQILLIPKIEVDTYWTSIDVTAKKVVRLYNDHGTSEQFHSEIKSDMGIERLPSAKFATNSLILLLGMVAYNALKLIGQKTLEKEDTPLRTKVERRRIKTIIQNIMYLASKIISHSKKIYMKISSNNSWSNTFLRIEKHFSTA